MSEPASDGKLAELLSGVAPLRNLDRNILLSIAGQMSVVEVEAGEALIRQGDVADRMFVILDGELEASITAQDGSRQVIRLMGPGEMVGEVALLAGGERTASVIASRRSRVASLSAAALDDLMEQDSDAAEQLTAIVVNRLRRSQLATHLSRLFGSLQLEALRDIEDAVEWIHLRSGDLLFRQGEEADAAYVLISGRLRVALTDADGNETVVNEVGRGEAVGEIALLTHGVRSATVYAMRESDLARFSRSAFDALTTKYPSSMVQMARLIGMRLQNVQSSDSSMRQRIDSIALIPTGDSLDLGPIVTRLSDAISRYRTVKRISASTVDQEFGREVARVGENDPSSIRLTSWLGEQDLLYDQIVFEADPVWDGWSQRIARQADLIVLVADARSDPAPSALERQLLHSVAEQHRQRLVLVLVHPPETERPSGTARWLDVRDLEAHYHVRIDRQSDFDRLARILTGNSIALALSGGGARGFAHLGVYRALVEEGVPIDIVGGTSQGSVIATNIALGFTPDQALDGCRSHFTSLFDYTLPVLSVVAGRRINSELRTTFGGIDIEDLWIPFACVSTNLTRASQVIHRRGPLWRAVRASVSLPGVMPPVYADGDLLVDGGLLNNLPGDVLRGLAAGNLIAVDVTPDVDLSVEESFEPEISGWSLIWSRINPFRKKHPFPSILSILTRSSVLGSIQARNRLLVEQMADLYLHPPVGEFPMLEFDAIDEITERGYESTRRQIREWWIAQSSP